jgi:hypothetical protein
MGIWYWGKLKVPGKGYHFPDGPYVEYVGTLDAQNSATI